LIEGVIERKEGSKNKTGKTTGDSLEINRIE
jgi:hypothetical protein